MLDICQQELLNLKTKLKKVLRQVTTLLKGILLKKMQKYQSTSLINIMSQVTPMLPKSQRAIHMLHQWRKKNQLIPMHHHPENKNQQIPMHHQWKRKSLWSTHMPRKKMLQKDRERALWRRLRCKSKPLRKNSTSMSKLRTWPNRQLVSPW